MADTTRAPASDADPDDRLAPATLYALQNAVYGGVTSLTQQPVTAAREAYGATAAAKSAV